MKRLKHMQLQKHPTCTQHGTRAKCSKEHIMEFSLTVCSSKEKHKGIRYSRTATAVPGLLSGSLLHLALDFLPLGKVMDNLIL